jgi:hypothetical protein
MVYRIDKWQYLIVVVYILKITTISPPTRPMSKSINKISKSEFYLPQALLSNDELKI